MSTKVKCPTCDKTCAFDSSNAYRPFCSERCRLIDLGKWASEDYKIPTITRSLTDNDEIEISEHFEEKMQ